MLCQANTIGYCNGTHNHEHMSRRISLHHQRIHVVLQSSSDEHSTQGTSYFSSKVSNQEHDNCGTYLRNTESRFWDPAWWPYATGACQKCYTVLWLPELDARSNDVMQQLNQSVGARAGRVAGLYRKLEEKWEVVLLKPMPKPVIVWFLQL